jgi:chromosome segregation protein
MEGMNEQLMQLRNEMDAKRIVMDEKNCIRCIAQRLSASSANQFEAEKKVVIADTSIQNLNRAVQQIDEDKVQEIINASNWQMISFEKEIEYQKNDLDQLQKHQDYTKDQILQTQDCWRHYRSKLAMKAGNSIQRKMA